MATKYILQLEDLSDQCFRKARAEMVCKAYKNRIANDNETARGQIMQQMSVAMGVTTKYIRDTLSEAGLETALPNYAACGAKAKASAEE